MILSENTFLLYAAKYYDNPQCSSIEEFEEDLKRFQYLRKLFGRYHQNGDLKERLILNHLIILYNCFGLETTNMLFLKLSDFHSYLKPFIEYLNYLPPSLEYNQEIINSSLIKSDENIKNQLLII